MRRKPSPKRSVAKRHIGEAVEIGRGYKARTPQAFFWRLIRRFLLFDILLDDFQGRAAARGCKIAPAPEPILPAPLSVDRLEWEHIHRVMAEHDGNISATARALRMHRRTLQRKLGKYPKKK